MSIVLSIEQIDLICNVSIVLDAAPESISYPSIWFATPFGCVNLDFEKKEIQLIDFRDISQKYFTLMGLGSMNKMEVVDYYSKNDSVL
jgi:hypothetical protein